MNSENYAVYVSVKIYRPRHPSPQQNSTNALQSYIQAKRSNEWKTVDHPMKKVMIVILRDERNVDHQHISLVVSLYDHHLFLYEQQRIHEPKMVQRDLVSDEALHMMQRKKTMIILMVVRTTHSEDSFHTLLLYTYWYMCCGIV
jgi:hypothetical protein